MGLLEKRDKKIAILDIPFTDTTVKGMTKIINKKIQHGEKCFIVTANPEIVMYAQENDTYKNIILSSDYIVPDGVGIIFASKILRTPLTERVAGFDLMSEMLLLAKEENYRIFLLGAKDSVVKRAVKNIREKYEGIQIVGYHHGYFRIEDQEIVEKVIATKPDIVFVATGYPRQETWIYNHQDKFSKGVFIGVGGSFDVLSGTVKRAPIFWRKYNIEWLYRLIQQPFRWKRVLQLPAFVVKVFITKFRGKVN